MSDVVVIGGGIVGASVCFYAQQRGLRCILVERDGVATHASGFAFGGLHPRVSTDASSGMKRFAQASFDEHWQLAECLTQEFGIHSSWHRRTSIALAFDELEATVLRNQASSIDSNLEWLDDSALHSVEPRISHAAIGGLLSADSAEVSTFELTHSLYDVSEAVIVSGEVVGVVLNGDRVTGVSLQDGTVIEGGSFVFAAGPWSTIVFDWFSLNIRVRPLKGQILRLSVGNQPFEHSFSTNGNYMSSKTDGLVWVGTTEEDVGMDEAPTEAGRKEILGVFQRMVPSVDEPKVVTQTACLRPISPNGELILGHVSGFSNALVGTGGGRKGILYGPLMGKYLTELIFDSSKSEPWVKFSPDRFLHTS